MYAVVATGGKQVKVAAGDVVVVEKLDAPVGETVNFNVIFLADDGEITVDADALAAATVTGEVVEHFKGEKAVVFKFKKRKGYKRLKGHRQDLTRVRITDVTGGEAAPAKKTTRKKAAPKPKAEEAPVEEPVEVTPVAEAAVETPETPAEVPAAEASTVEAPAEETAPEAAESAENE